MQEVRTRDWVNPPTAASYRRGELYLAYLSRLKCSQCGAKGGVRVRKGWKYYYFFWDKTHTCRQCGSVLDERLLKYRARVQPTAEVE